MKVPATKRDRQWPRAIPDELLVSLQGDEDALAVAPTQEEAVYRDEQRRALEHVLRHAFRRRRDQWVIRRRVGWDAPPPCYTPLTLAQCGVALGVGRERVRRIEARALRILRHPSNSRALAPFSAYRPCIPWMNAKAPWWRE